MLLALIAAGLLQSPVHNAPAFVERPCADATLTPIARCGTVSVPENRDRPDVRQIELSVVILPGTSGDANLPPIFSLEGGPGLAAATGVGFYASDGAGYRVRRDIVFVDQRGTGRSNRLSCPALEGPEGAHPEMYPAQAVEACLDDLSQRADLVRYGTNDAVQDLDAARAALGHDRIDLVALSYGTTMALRYMSTYPGRVRAAVLLGTAPADARPPRLHAPSAERSLALVFEDCRREPDCRAAFPSPEGDLRRALDRLSPSAGDPTPEIFMEGLRTLLYQPLTARRAPWIINRAANGDLAPFRAATARRGPSPFAEGVYLSITCGESLALMDLPAARSASRATLFGDYRLRRQAEACSVWPTLQAAPDHLTPAAGDAAVLFISGRLDPATPPEWAEAASAGFPNSRHLIIPNSAHVFDGLSGIDSCLDPLLIEFLETADAEALDPACLADMLPPPFQTPEQ